MTPCDDAMDSNTASCAAAIATCQGGKQPCCVESGLKSTALIARRERATRRECTSKWLSHTL